MAIEAPVEFRHYMKLFAIEDARAGINPIRQATGPIVNGQAPSDLFCPPVLQYRYKRKVHLNGAPAVDWSEWLTIGIVREGDTA